MTAPLVSTRDEMTAPWFTRILTDSGALSDGKVGAVDLETVNGGVMTNMLRARLSYSGGKNGPASILVKYPSDDAGNLGIAKAMGLYELEVLFYSEIAPKLQNLSIPNCYYAQLDENSGRFALALEDLSASTTSGVSFETLTEAQCSAVFQQLVNFQAPLWNKPKGSQATWLEDETRTLAIFDATPAGLEPFLARFGDFLDSDHVRLFESVLPLAGKWARANAGPKVLQHAEFRNANVLFGATPEAHPVTIIDFQTVRTGTPGVDPAYFMGASLPTDDRRSIEEDVIKNYHEQLIGAGVENFDWNDCWHAYRDGAMYGVYLLVGMAGQVEPSEQNNRIILGMVDRFATMALDLDAPKAAGLI